MAIRQTQAADGARLSYDDDGSGEPAVLLVHGWMATHGVWGALRPLLGERRVVAPDLRGTGESSGGADGYTLDQLADDVVRVAEAAGLESFHLVGHSMGGQVAQRVAARVPARLRTLALVNPVPLGGLALPAELAAGFRAAGGRRDALGGILDAACRTLAPADRERLVDTAAGIDPSVIAAGLDAWTRGLPGDGPLGIRCSTVVVATDDPFLPPVLLEEAVVRRITGARLERVPGPGHYPQLEAPAALARVLRELWAPPG